MGIQGLKMEAKQEDLVLEHMLFIKSIAFKYAKGSDEKADELISVGVIGFLESFARFDSTKGWKLSSYACECAKYKILEHIRRTAYRGLGWKYKDISKISIAFSKVDSSGWRTKDITAFAKENDTTVRVVETLLNTKSCNDGVDDVLCTSSPQKNAELTELVEHVQEYADSLNADDREVFDSVILGQGLSLNKIGKKRGVSLSRKSIKIQESFFEAMQAHRGG